MVHRQSYDNEHCYQVTYCNKYSIEVVHRQSYDNEHCYQVTYCK